MYKLCDCNVIMRLNNKLQTSNVNVLALFVALLLSFFACGQKEKTIDELLALGQKSYDSGDYFESRALFAKALEKEPSNRYALYHLGRNYFAENMYDSSYATLSRVEKLYPGSREVNTILHQASAMTGHYQDAINSLLALARTGEPIEKYYKQIAEYAYTDTIAHTAYFYYRKLIETEPDSLNYYLRCAESAVYKGDVPAGIEVLKLALKRFGDKPQLLSYLGQYHSSIQAYPESETVLRRLLQVDSSTVFQLQLATSLAFQDDKAKKREAYDIFRRLRAKTAETSRIDSLISYLERELGIK